ncbi:MAG TPA: AAA family ATPase, partial [Polyangia bacterium]|nr:AAA family ATPase [Polyangia bacterium]
MITRAHIRNFRCLLDVDLTFEPLTILVGPNASGKSAILAALHHASLEAHINGWRHQVPAEVRIAN